MLRCDTLLVRFWCLIWGVPAVCTVFIEIPPWWGMSWSTVIILVFTLCLGFGAVLGHGRIEKNKAFTETTSTWNLRLKVKHHWYIGLACSLPSYLSVYFLLNDLGHGYAVFSDLGSFVAAAAAVSQARYAENFDPAAITRMLNTFVFLSAFVAGWYTSRGSAPKRWLFVVVLFVPALAWTVLLTTKANLLFWLVCFLSSYLAFDDIQLHSKQKIRMALYLITLGLALLALMMGVQLSRRGATTLLELPDVAESILVAALGHYYAFREWFYTSANWLPLSLGGGSFSGIFEILGISPRLQGVYGTQNIDVGNSYTNVYSALRGVIEDAGLLLSCILFILAGWSGVLFERNRHATAHAFLTLQLAWILFSPIVSIWNYNSILLAGAMFVLLSISIRK
jgi:oligosaccharide repeat unit polymerase